MPPAATPLFVASFVLTACSEAPAPGLPAEQIVADEPPVMVTGEIPFQYPPALYARRAQGNVILRLHVGPSGLTVPESTSVVEGSGEPGFDSAAVRGAAALRFIPAKFRGEPTGMTILFPVHFRHPEVPSVAVDSALNRKARGG